MRNLCWGQPKSRRNDLRLESKVGRTRHERIGSGAAQRCHVGRFKKTLPNSAGRPRIEVFKNVHDAHRRAKEDASILRISIDNKAKVKLGPFSRGGKTRNYNEIHAADHDLGGQSITPCGLLEIESAQLFITFVQGPVTADTTADQLEQWWIHRKQIYPSVRKLMIDLDNGPEVSSKPAFQKINQSLERQAGIEKWSVIIRPQLSNSAP